MLASLWLCGGGRVRNIQADIVSDSLNNKLNWDCLNIDKATALKVVTTYRNGTSGYILYDNKYCIQWGRYFRHGSIEFLLEFKDTSYDVHTQMLFLNSGTGYPNFNWIDGLDVYDLTTTGFTAGSFNGDDTYFDYERCWVACGYIK